MILNSATRRPVTRRAAHVRGVLLGACLLSACSQMHGEHVQGTTTLSDGKILKATGSGPDVEMNWKCLKEDAVVQLTGHPLPAGTPKSACYMTVLVAARSSDASRAVTAYLARSGALQSQAATIALLARRVATSARTTAAPAGPRAVRPAVGPAVGPAEAAAPAVTADATLPTVPSVPDTSPTASVVNSVAATAAIAPDSSTIQAAASSLGPLLSPATKQAVQQQLETLSVQTPDPSLADRLHEAADQIGQAQ